MARGWPLLIWAAALLAAPSALAQTERPIVVSAAAQDVAVTVYRAPNRGSGPIDPRWPRGFAFITESRRVTLPAGVAIAGHALMLQVQAWDAPEVTPFSVASIRRLRIPSDLPGPAGRNSRAIRRWSL